MNGHRENRSKQAPNPEFQVWNWDPSSSFVTFGPSSEAPVCPQTPVYPFCLFWSSRGILTMIRKVTRDEEGQLEFRESWTVFSGEMKF